MENKAYDHLDPKKLRDLPSITIPHCGQCGKRHVLTWINAGNDMYGGHYEHGHCSGSGKNHVRTVIGIRNIPLKLRWHEYWYAKQFASKKVIASIGG